MQDCNTIIIDDNELDQLTVNGMLLSFPEFKVVGSFGNGPDALASGLLSSAEAIFLDIEMGGMNGIEMRRNLTHIPVCIFITDHPEYAIESFELDTLDYLVKPISSERFTKTIERIREFRNLRQKASLLDQWKGDDKIILKNGTQTLRLSLQDIIYFQSYQNYTAIVTATEKHLIHTTLNNLLQNPAFTGFTRVHKSYAIQNNKLKKIIPGELILDNDVHLPVGRTYRDSIRHL